MADRSTATLEQRLTVLEGELWKANERVRVLEGRQRWTARWWSLAVSIVTGLALTWTLVVPVRGSDNVYPAGAWFKAPFHVFGQNRKPILEVIEAPNGGGAIDIVGYDGHSKLVMGVGDSGGGAVNIFSSRNVEVAALGVQTEGHGVLQLENRAGTISVQAGTLRDGSRGYVAAATNGVIKVEGSILNPSVIIGPK
ncbi:MAG TPA: hypothetical protein VKV57_16340 [bacterium]|nr:hypothetical protein [bacterium]